MSTVAKEERWKFDAAGWTFWLVIFLILVGPSVYGAWKIVYSSASRTVPISAGIVFAAIGAGFISWTVNAVIQRKRKKERIQRRKKARKQK
jgi:TRAP-type C4-dicarboxylate transport system permease small subunit